MSLPVTRTFSGVTGAIPTADETQWAYNNSNGPTNFVIVSNGGMGYVVADNTADNILHWTGDTFADSHYSEVKLGTISTLGSSPGQGYGPAVRCDTATTHKQGYRLICDSHGWELGKCANPTFTSIASASLTFVIGDLVKLWVIKSGANDLLYLTRNGATLGASPYTVTSPLTGGAAGFAHSSTTNSTGVPSPGIDQITMGNVGYVFDVTTAGSFVIQGQSVVLRPGSNTYLRYRK